MGVSAVFVSTLALTRLPAPHTPPRDQTELLAATLQVIVSFVVLGSIFVRKQMHFCPVAFGRVLTNRRRRPLCTFLFCEPEARVANRLAVAPVDFTPFSWS